MVFSSSKIGYVPVDELRQKIFLEAHNSHYTIYFKSIKMYQDQKKSFC